MCVTSSDRVHLMRVSVPPSVYVGMQLARNLNSVNEIPTYDIRWLNLPTSLIAGALSSPISSPGFYTRDPH